MGGIGGWFLEAGVSEVGGPGAKAPPPHPQSERDELTEDGEGSIRSSEDGAGDSGEWDWGPGAGMEHQCSALPAASHPGPALASPVFTAPAESEGSGPEEKSPGQQVRLC